MLGIAHVINIPATLVNIRRASPIKGIDKHFFKQIIMSIITGSIRAGDKRHQAHEIESDMCGFCNSGRQTAEHLFWECPWFADIRSLFLTRGRKIREALFMVNPGAYAEFNTITGCAAWRCCGIAAETLGAINEYNNRPSVEFIQRTPDRDQLVYHDSQGASHHTCPSTGKRFVNVYGDGFLLHGRSVWHARAAWGLWIGRGHPGNDA